MLSITHLIVLFVAGGLFYGSLTYRMTNGNSVLAESYDSTYVLVERYNRPEEFASIDGMLDVAAVVSNLLEQDCSTTDHLTGNWIYRLRISKTSDCDTEETRYYYIYTDGYVIEYPPVCHHEAERYLLSAPNNMTSFITVLDELYQQYEDGYAFKYKNVGGQHGSTQGHR